MRKIPASALATFSAFVVSASLLGCSAPVDTTPNQVDPMALNYPAGPYGYVEGAVVADYKFLGKVPTAGDYSALPMRELRLSEFHNDPAVKLLLIEGSANWCYFCNEEAPAIEQLSVDHFADGYRAVTVLAEGSIRGTPSNADDITNWVERHAFVQTGMAIDPEARLFQYAPASAFPLHILLDTKTMQIKWLCVGGQGACNTEAAVTDALGTL